jgi:hypothetical protein
MTLKPPTSYQGGKARIAKKIASILIAEGNKKYYDLCCGSGAVSLQLVNSGVSPDQIIMLDRGPWGLVWKAVGEGSFDLTKLESHIDKMPKNPVDIQPYIKALAKQPVGKDAIYTFLLLQASSFGSKPIWIDGISWKNCSFRRYWMPTPTSNRRSPVNPMMPMPSTLLERMRGICKQMKGVTGVCDDIQQVVIETPATVYIDPPYLGRTGYGFDFDAVEYAKKLGAKCFLSEGQKLSPSATLMAGSSDRRKGGISGVKKVKANEEWLNVFTPSKDDLIIQTVNPSKATTLACSFGWLMRSPISGAILPNLERECCEKKLKTLGKNIPWAPMSHD